jgi:hypothetical protein
MDDGTLVKELYRQSLQTPSFAFFKKIKYAFSLI